MEQKPNEQAEVTFEDLKDLGRMLSDKAAKYYGADEVDNPDSGKKGFMIYLINDSDNESDMKSKSSFVGNQNPHTVAAIIANNLLRNKKFYRIMSEAFHMVMNYQFAALEQLGYDHRNPGGVINGIMGKKTDNQ